MGVFKGFCFNIIIRFYEWAVLCDLDGFSFASLYCQKDAGMNDFISKPIDMERLFKLLDYILCNHDNP